MATWRRWEDDPDSVSTKTRRACERVLADAAPQPLSTPADSFVAAWYDSPRLTPRQAYAIALQLSFWADSEIAEWLRNASEPLHDVGPFDQFDLRVMMLVRENRAWAEAVGRRCRVIVDELADGMLPFDRQGPLIDEVLIGAALQGAQEMLSKTPEHFEEIQPRAAVPGDEVYSVGDDDWDAVSSIFDDACLWDEWMVPLQVGHPLLPVLLADRHPFRWFDDVKPSGRGYLERLEGLAGE